MARTKEGRADIKFIPFNPNLVSEVWVFFSKEAILNRNVIYWNEDDASTLLHTLHKIAPFSSFYCRSQIIGSSMNNVYSITLPQLLRSSTDKKVSFGVSKNIKHFAIKIISDEKLFSTEVECLQKISSWITNQKESFDSDCSFYALGSLKVNSEGFKPFSTEGLLHFQSWSTLLPELIQSKISNFENMPIKPWWIYLPEATTLKGGVIIMKCGDDKQAGDKETIKRNLPYIMEDIHFWLRSIHAANVLHRDIRIRNILRFSNVEAYIPRDDDSRQLDKFKSLSISRERFRGEWQLIDFNISSCDTSERNVVTTIHKDSGQGKHAGWRVCNLFSEDSPSIEVIWEKSDDYEMLTSSSSRDQSDPSKEYLCYEKIPHSSSLHKMKEINEGQRVRRFKEIRFNDYPVSIKGKEGRRQGEDSRTILIIRKEA